MTYEEAVQEIESHEFSARLGIASDFKTFTHIAVSQPSVKELFTQLKKPEIEESLYNRTVDLSRRSIDPSFENPLDKALAIYLWVTDLRNPNLALLMSEHIIHAPQCWWAHKLSKHLRKVRAIRERSEAANHIENMGPVSLYNVGTMKETYGAVLAFNLYPGKKSQMPRRIIFGTDAEVEIWEQQILPDDADQLYKMRRFPPINYEVAV